MVRYRNCSRLGLWKIKKSETVCCDNELGYAHTPVENVVKVEKLI